MKGRGRQASEKKNSMAKSSVCGKTQSTTINVYIHTYVHIHHASLVFAKNRDTYQAVYTIRFADRVYVVHVFKKKSKSGIATPKSDVELIDRRLKQVGAIEKQRSKTP
jgi:phage-related protein